MWRCVKEMQEEDEPKELEQGFKANILLKSIDRMKLRTFIVFMLFFQIF